MTDVCHQFSGDPLPFISARAVHTTPVDTQSSIRVDGDVSNYID